MEEEKFDLPEEVAKDKVEKTKENNNLTNTPNKRKLSFWVGVVCIVVIVCQFVLTQFLSINFETKVIVEVLSLALTILVWFGILKTDNGDKENFDTLKANITKEIASKVDEFCKPQSKTTSNEQTKTQVKKPRKTKKTQTNEENIDDKQV